MKENILGPIRWGLLMGIVALIGGALWAAYLATHHEQFHGSFEKQAQNKNQHMMSSSDMGMESMHGLDSAHEHGESAGNHQQDMESMANDHHAAPVAGHHQQAMESMANDHHAAPVADHHQQGMESMANDHHAAPVAGHHQQGGESMAPDEQHSHSGSLPQDAMQRLIRGHIHAMGLGVLVCVLLLVVAMTKLKDCWKRVFAFSFGFGALLYPPAWVIMGFRTVEMGPEAAEASIMWLFGPAVGLVLASMLALFVVLLLEGLGWSKAKLFAWAFER